MRRGFLVFIFILAGLIPAFAGGMVESKLYFGLSRSKVLVIVHPDTDDAAKALSEIKASYCERFHQISVFQTDQDVRVVE
jgi:hypothetical protein